MGFVLRLNVILPSFRVDVVFKDPFLDLYMSCVNVIELLKELANVVKSFGQSGFSTHFISISSINRNQLKHLQGALRSRFRSISP